MTNFTKTISNSINLFASPTDNWLAWNWNSFLWGAGTADLQVSVGKLISEAITPSDAMSERMIGHVIAESLSLDSDMTSEILTDGEGYSYLFTKPVVNAENRSTATYTSGSNAGTSYNSLTAGSTVWS